MTRREGLPTWLSPVWLVLGAIVSVQFGAAIAKSLFAVVDPTAIAWLRMAFASLVFFAIARPRFAGRTWPEWRVALGYGLCLATMNWAIYQSFARIPLGLAVTIEFLGPLAVAVATSRRLRDLVWAGLAAAGVLLLGWSPAPLDPVGIGFALLAGAAWAGYILLSGPVGRAWSGLTGASVGSLVGALGWAIPGIVAGGVALWQPWVLLV
ncbi:MAG: EamA family transporter, partial [Propionicimonas sp.]|nr:EamA family transporter [Propionicimonas sp.]